MYIFKIHLPVFHHFLLKHLSWRIVGRSPGVQVEIFIQMFSDITEENPKGSWFRSAGFDYKFMGVKSACCNYNVSQHVLKSIVAHGLDMKFACSLREKHCLDQRLESLSCPHFSVFHQEICFISTHEGVERWCKCGALHKYQHQKSAKNITSITNEKGNHTVSPPWFAFRIWSMSNRCGHEFRQRWDEERGKYPSQDWSRSVPGWIEDFTQPGVHDEVCSWNLLPH